jgi:hypothetical protein
MLLVSDMEEIYVERDVKQHVVKWKMTKDGPEPVEEVTLPL